VYRFGWGLLARDENVPVLWSRSLVLEHYSLKSAFAWRPRSNS
jgi:hypothetical protein